jgi:hypothetical protein
LGEPKDSSGYTKIETLLYGHGYIIRSPNNNVKPLYDNGFSPWRDLRQWFPTGPYPQVVAAHPEAEQNSSIFSGACAVFEEELLA